MTKLDTVLEAIHAIHSATLHADSSAYLSERDEDVVYRLGLAGKWLKSCTDDEDRLSAMRAHTELQEELIFLRLAQKLLPVIGPLLASGNDELLTPISTSTATSTA